MASAYDIAWFKVVIAPRLLGYTITYRYFEQGDFGSLYQVEFNSVQKGGAFDFWGMDWLGIHLVDYRKDVALVNKLLTDAEEHEKRQVIATFLSLL
jgi:hypothetical protein